MSGITGGRGEKERDVMKSWLAYILWKERERKKNSCDRVQLKRRNTKSHANVVWAFDEGAREYIKEVTEARLSKSIELERALLLAHIYANLAEFWKTDTTQGIEHTHT